MQLPTSLGIEYNQRVRTYDIDSQKRMTVPSLVRTMQEAAMQNVIELKLSVWDLEPEGVSWVLMRSYIDIRRLPILGERLKVATYPSGFEKLFTYRDYVVYDEADQWLARSSSTWVLMDSDTRRLVNIPSRVKVVEERMPAVGDCLPRPGGKLPPWREASRQLAFQVGFLDLDFNDHLSNTFYLKWMLETMPLDWMQNDFPKRLELSYRAEAVYGDDLHAELCPLDERSFLHRLINASDGKELASMRTVW